MNGCKGCYKDPKPEEREISLADSDFVIKHQESEISMLNSDLPKAEVGFPFSISNDFNVKIAIMVRNITEIFFAEIVLEISEILNSSHYILVW